MVLSATWRIDLLQKPLSSSQTKQANKKTVHLLTQAPSANLKKKYFHPFFFSRLKQSKNPG